MSTEPINRENLVQAQQNQAERQCDHPIVGACADHDVCLDCGAVVPLILQERCIHPGDCRLKHDDGREECVACGLELFGPYVTVPKEASPEVGRVHPDDEMDAKVISKARVSVEFAYIDLHDKATELLDSLRVGDINADLEAGYYDCPLCGATMFVSIDYPHKTDCPYEAFGRAIDVFSRAVRAALPALPKPSDEEPKATLSNPHGRELA